MGMNFFQFEGVFDRLVAADARTVISVFISTADALDHHQALGAQQAFISLADPLLQFEVGQYLFIFTVKVLRGLIRLGTYGDDSGAVLDLGWPSFRFILGQNIAIVRGRVGFGGLRI